MVRLFRHGMSLQRLQHAEDLSAILTLPLLPFWWLNAYSGWPCGLLRGSLIPFSPWRAFRCTIRIDGCCPRRKRCFITMSWPAANSMLMIPPSPCCCRVIRRRRLCGCGRTFVMIATPAQQLRQRCGSLKARTEKASTRRPILLASAACCRRTRTLGSASCTSMEK